MLIKVKGKKEKEKKNGVIVSIEQDGEPIAGNVEGRINLIDISGLVSFGIYCSYS